MTTLTSPPANAPLHSGSSAHLLESDATPLGWLHMPGFGSGYRDFASRSIVWPALPANPVPASSALPHDSFWSSVARHGQS